ncbi:MAG: hypothetical protein IJ209_02110 [Bacteroidaceae bacterium]|nr:hypothetical protein [Bacteroidaceae bacterium]
MNDDITNRPRDNTASQGDDFPEVKTVATAFCFSFSTAQVITNEELERLVINVGKICYSLGLAEGRADAFHEIAIMKSGPATKAEPQTPHIVVANKAEINEQPTTHPG